MQKQLLYALFTLLVWRAGAQTSRPISIGHADSLYSKILNESRYISIYLPQSGAPAGIFSAQRYPVVFLLDGDAHFHSVSGMVQQLSQVNGNTAVPEMIVVGIHNTDRTRDLTPFHVDSDPPAMSPEFSKTSGGGENFIAFIEKELIPYIETKYPAAPYRTLIGHSFGGLTVMQCLTKHPQLFNAYICIDPSMWYGGGRFLNEVKESLSKSPSNNASLYLGIANTMPAGMSLQDMRRDTQATTRHIRQIFALDDYLRANKVAGLRYNSKYYPDDSHGSAPLIVTYDALRFLFDFYDLKLSMEDWLDVTPRIAEKYAAHYATVSQKLGYRVSPPEGLINGMGYQALGQKHLQKAERLFRMNVENYPDSYNTYDSYGDYFDAAGDAANALAQFKRSLERNPANTHAAERVSQLTMDAARKAQPPVETGDFKPTHLVELVALDPTFKLDIRYAASNNFTKRPVYTEARAFMQRPAAEALAAVQRELRPLGLGLLIFDGYRPWSVTKFFWDITPEKDRIFVANPQKGSKHNRGCAVDLTLYDLATGQEIQMPGAYDEFSERSFPTYTGGTDEQRRMRDLLRSKMEAQGFTVDGNEWWHFDYKDWKSYRIGNIPFSEIKSAQPAARKNKH